MSGLIVGLAVPVILLAAVAVLTCVIVEPARMRDRRLLRLHRRFERVTLNNHLRTDPACIEYRAPRPRTRLDRRSRGVACARCGWIRRLGSAWSQLMADDPTTPAAGL